MPGLFGLPTIDEIFSALQGIANPLESGLGTTLETVRAAGEDLGVPGFLLPGNDLIGGVQGVDAGVADLADAVSGIPSLPDVIRGVNSITGTGITGAGLTEEAGNQALGTTKSQTVTPEDIDRLMQFINENGITGITREDLQRQADLGIVFPALKDAVTAQGQLESQRGFLGGEATRLTNIGTDPSALRTDAEFGNRLAGIENSLTASDQGFQRDINQLAASTGAGGISGRAGEISRARQFQTGLAKGRAFGALSAEAFGRGKEFEGLASQLPSQVSFTDPFGFTKGIQAADIGTGSQLVGIGLAPAQLGIDALGAVNGVAQSSPFSQILDQGVSRVGNKIFGGG